MEEIIEYLLFKTNRIGKYVANVLICALMCSWHGLIGYSNEDYIQNLINYYIYIFPIHFVLSYILVIAFLFFFRSFLKEEKGYKVDKDDRIEEWEIIYPHFNQKIFLLSAKLSTIIICFSIYFLNIAYSLNIIHIKINLPMIFAEFILIFGILFIVVLLLFSRKIFILEIFKYVHERTKTGKG